MSRRILLVGIDQKTLTEASALKVKEQLADALAGVVDEVLVVGGMTSATVVETVPMTHYEPDYPETLGGCEWSS